MHGPAPIHGRPRRAILSAVLSALLLLAAAAGAGSRPRPGAASLGPDGELRLGPRDRCPVCAMRPVQYPRSAAALETADGATFYFCCPGCLLQAWVRPEAFLGRPADQLQRAVVQEYFSGALRDAREVLWIAGSEVTGPMGPELVPLADAAAAEVFRRRHGGGPPFHLEALTPESWTTLTGKAP